MPSMDWEVQAKWTANSDTRYTVKHLLENANDE
jgi:hypothetical protein